MSPEFRNSTKLELSVKCNRSLSLSRPLTQEAEEVLGIRTQPSLSLDPPEPLFSADAIHVDLSRGYDVSRDGQYFIAVQEVRSENVPRGITMVENWHVEFEED